MLMPILEAKGTPASSTARGDFVDNSSPFAPWLRTPLRAVKTEGDDDTTSDESSAPRK